MKRNSIAFQINLGFGVLVTLVVTLGGFAYFSVGHIAAGLHQMAGETSAMGETLSGTVAELEALERSVTSLANSAQEFETLKDVGQQLQDSRKSTAGMSARLSEVNTAFLNQRQALESINTNAEALAEQTRVAARDVQKILRAVEDTHANLLQSFIGFFNFLNESSLDVKQPIARTDAAAANLKTTRELAPLIDPSGKIKKTIGDMEQDLRRYRQYMTDLGKTTSATQIAELKEPIARYGNKLIKSAEGLRSAIRQWVENRSTDIIKIADETARTAQSAMEASNAGVQLIENAIGVTLVANTTMGKAVDRLSSTLSAVSASMGAVPLTVRQASASLRTLTDTLSGLDKAKLLAERSTKTANVMNGAVVGVCLLAAIVGIAIGIIISRQVVKPLGRFTEGLKQVAANDLTVQVDQRGTSGELAELIGGVNKLVRALRQSVVGMRELGDQVLQSADSLGQVTVKSSQSLDDQRKKSEQIASATEQLTASIQEVASSASTASHTATDAANEGSKGRDVVNGAMESINVLAGTFRDAGQAMADLRKKSDDIGVVLEVIQEIAEQTNLLALNASIEAARAGEHGRGFAVVADEVRLLASRTRESTQRIHDLIGALQSGAEDAAQAMEQGSAQMEKTVGEAAMAGDALVAINNAVSTINDMNLMIARATEQQTQTAEEINNAILVISSLSAQTATGAQESAHAAEHLSSSVKGLKRLVDQFAV